MLMFQLLERKTIDSQKIIKSRGKSLFKDVEKAILTISWKSIVDFAEPVNFISPLGKLLNKIEKNQKLVGKDVKMLEELSSNMIDYLYQMDKKNQTTYAKMKAETNALNRVWEQYGSNSMISVKWLSKGLRLVLNALENAQREAMQNTGYIVGQILEQCFYSGETFATEAILFSFMTIFESTVSSPTPDFEYPRKVGIEMYYYLDRVTDNHLKYAKNVNIQGLSNHRGVINWFATSMKTVPEITIIGINNIMLSCIESLQFMFDYYMGLYGKEFSIASYETETQKLREIAIELMESDEVSIERKERLKKAIYEADRVSSAVVPKPGTVSPHLVAHLLRQLFFQEKIDFAVGQQVLKQRFGPAFTNIIGGAFESHELLRQEIHLAFLTRDLPMDSKKIEGLWDWLFGKDKPKPNEPVVEPVVLPDQNEIEEEEIRLRRWERIKSRRLGGQDLPPTEEARNKYRDRLLIIRRDLQDNLRMEQAKIRRQLQGIENDNNTTTVEVMEIQKRSYKPGQTRAILKAGESVRKIGDQAVEYTTMRAQELEDQIEQVDWEIAGIDNDASWDEFRLTTIEKRWMFVVLGLIGVGSILYLGHGWYSQAAQVATTTWEAMQKQAYKDNAGAVFEILKSHWETNQGIQATTKIATVHELKDVANALLYKLVVFAPKTPEIFLQFIEPYGIMLQGIIVGTRDDNLRQMAIMANEQIIRAATKFKPGVQRAAVNAIHKVMLVSVQQLMDGQLPSNLDTLLAGLKNIPVSMFSQIGSFWKAWKPSPSSFTSGAGLLSLVSTTASSTFVDAVKKNFIAYHHVVFGYMALVIIFAAAVARIIGISQMTAYNTPAGVIKTFTGFSLAFMAITNVMFDKISDATAANATVFWDNFMFLGPMLAIAASLMGFLSPFGMLTKAVQWGSNSFSGWRASRLQQQQQQQMTAITQQQPEPTPISRPGTQAIEDIVQPTSTTSVRQRRTALVGLEDNQARMLSETIERRTYQIAAVPNNNNETTSAEEEEEEKKPFVTPSELRSCIICSNQSAFICSHCDTHHYCSRACARKDWSVIQKKHISLLKK